MRWIVRLVVLVAIGCHSPGPFGLTVALAEYLAGFTGLAGLSAETEAAR